MSETKPVYEIPGEVLEGAILEQMRAIHEEFIEGRRNGEFTIKDYAEAMEIKYSRAQKELMLAFDAGRLEKRGSGSGSRAYYRMKEKDSERKAH